jgi:hypothetical protein
MKGQMKKIRYMPIVWVILLSLIVSQQPIHGSLLEDISFSFIHGNTTSHAENYPIAKPLSDGPLRILFIGQKEQVGRLSIEIPARLECHNTTILTENRTCFISDDPVVSSLLEAEITRSFQEMLHEHVDVLWLDYDLQSLPEDIQEALFHKVEAGTGLIYVGEVNTVKRHTTKAKIDTRLLKTCTFGTFSPEYTGKMGKGLVVTMPPYISGENFHDYCTCAIETILFASGRHIETFIIPHESSGKVIQQEAITIINHIFTLVHKGNQEDVNVYKRFRNIEGDIVFEHSELYKVSQGVYTNTITYPLLPIGDYSLDISVINSHGVVSLAGKTFRVTAMQFITGIDLKTQSTTRNDFISGTLYLSHALKEGMYLKAELYDTWGQLISTSILENMLNRKKVDFIFPLRRSKGKLVSIRIHLYKSNVLVQTYVTYARVIDESNKRNFSFIVGNEEECKEPSHHYYRILRDAGVTAFAIKNNDSTDSLAAHSVVLPALETGADIIPFSEADYKNVLFSSNTYRIREALILPAKKKLSSFVIGDEEIVKGGEMLLRMLPWVSVFSGVRSLWWESGWGRWDSAVTPFYSLSPAFSVVAEETQGITNGIDILLSGCEKSVNDTSLTIFDSHGNTIPHVTIILFTDNEYKYIGMLCESSPGIVHDETATVTINNYVTPPAVYDVRQGSFIGVTTQIQVQVKPGKAFLFALLPHRVKSLDLTLEHNIIKSGDDVHFRVDIVSQHPEFLSERHVVRVKIIDPQGSEKPYLSDVFEGKDGVVQATFRIAPNEPTGQWKICVTDVASGKDTERNFMVMSVR